MSEYVGVLDSLKKQLRFMKILITVLIVLLCIALLNNHKPPIVIRETSKGAELIKDYIYTNVVNDLDINLFIDHFVHRMNLVDSFGLVENLPEALNMMSPKLSDHYQKNVLTDKLLEDIVEAKNRTTTKVLSVDIDDTYSHMPTTITYERNVIEFPSGKESKMIVRAESIIEKVKRSEVYPYGLRITEYKEMRLN